MDLGVQMQFCCFDILHSGEVYCIASSSPEYWTLYPIGRISSLIPLPSSHLLEPPVSITPFCMSIAKLPTYPLHFILKIVSFSAYFSGCKVFFFFLFLSQTMTAFSVCLFVCLFLAADSQTQHWQWLIIFNFSKRQTLPPKLFDLAFPTSISWSKFLLSSMQPPSSRLTVPVQMIWLIYWFQHFLVMYSGKEIHSCISDGFIKNHLQKNDCIW